MSDLLPVWCELICDECSRQLAGEWTSRLHIPREQLKAQVEREGGVIRDNVVFCKACASKNPAAGSGEE